MLTVLEQLFIYRIDEMDERTIGPEIGFVGTHLLVSTQTTVSDVESSVRSIKRRREGKESDPIDLSHSSLNVIDLETEYPFQRQDLSHASDSVCSYLDREYWTCSSCTNHNETFLEYCSACESKKSKK